MEIKLPDTIIETARQLYGESVSHQWLIGDFLVEVIDEISPVYKRLRDGDNVMRRIRAGILRQVATGIGCDVTTLRDRESMARFFPVEVREEYSALTYHQLRACKAAGDSWKDHADWALENLPAPVALIRRRIKANGNDVPAWVSRWERIIVIAEQIKDDPRAPDKVRRAASDILRSGVMLP